VALADRLQAAAEILARTLFPGDHLQVGKQTDSSVIAAGIAALDLGFDLPPDAFAAPDNGLEPRAAIARSVFLPPLPLGCGLVGSGTLAGEPDLVGAVAREGCSCPFRSWRR
jgi:hypothetical protein